MKYFRHEIFATYVQWFIIQYCTCNTHVCMCIILYTSSSIDITYHCMHISHAGLEIGYLIQALVADTVIWLDNKEPLAAY